MIEWSSWILILGFAVPMIISPGPGNSVLAVTGAQFGVRGTAAFWCGFEAGNFLLCLIYGFGLGEVVTSHPAVYQALKWAGTAYILYLAWGFFQPSALKSGQNLQRPGFADGLTALLLNPKVHSMILVMYSQFLKPSLPLAAQVLQIAVVFLLLGVFCHYLWIYAGQVIFRRFNGAAAMRVQGIVFGVCMVAVAIFVAMS